MRSYALDVGLRHLRSKKRASISVISSIAITGLALGVAALLTVISITWHVLPSEQVEIVMTGKPDCGDATLQAHANPSP